jgi:hypothetical protein
MRAKLPNSPELPQSGGYTAFVPRFYTLWRMLKNWSDDITIQIEEVDAQVQREAVIIACSDETPALTTGTKVTFRMPYAFTVSDVKASLTTAQSSGSIFTVDVHASGTTILSTKVTIDNGEKTSVTAATPRVISDSSLTADEEMKIDIDQVGDGTAAGLKVTIIGTQV